VKVAGPWRQESQKNKLLHAGNHGRLRVAVKQFRTIEVVGLSSMPVLCERGDSHGCYVPRVDERDALCSRAVGEGALSYLLRVAEEVLHEVICSQDGIGNAALPDSPLSVAIPLREANDGFSSWRPWTGEPGVTRNSVSIPLNAAARLSELSKSRTAPSIPLSPSADALPWL